MEKIKNEIARKFIEDHGATFHSATATHSFYKKGHIVICIPLNSDIDYIQLQAIAAEQLNVSLQPEYFNKELTSK